MSDTDQVTHAASAAVQALSELVVAAAVPVLADRVALVRADLRKEMRLHFGIGDQQAAILDEQRRTIETLIGRLDQAEMELAHLTIDLGIERILGRHRDDQIQELGAAHNALVTDARAHLEQLRSQLDDRDQALTEAEARIADLEKQVFSGCSGAASFRRLSDQDFADIATGTWRLSSDPGTAIYPPATPEPEQSPLACSPSHNGRHCGCKTCCWCKTPREA